MKRLIMFFGVLACVNMAVFAQKFGLSVGGGANFVTQFSSYVFSDLGKSLNLKAEDYDSVLVGGGFYGMFDATYVEITTGFLFGGSKRKIGDLTTETGISAITLGAFGKYPVDMGGFTLFPMLGMEGQFNLGGSINGHEVNTGVDSFNRAHTFLWFKGGVGADIPIVNRLFIRPEFLYGIRVNTESEQDMIDGYLAPTVEDANHRNKLFDAIIGHGLDLRVALGYSFF